MRRHFGLMGAVAALAASAAAVMPSNRSLSEAESTPFMLTHGGYTNQAHGWGGKRRKVKGYMKGQQPRRSKAARRARAG